MANRSVYVNPLSPTASDSNTGADNSANALLSFSGVENTSSLNIFVEANSSFSGAATFFARDHKTEVRIQKNGTGANPVLSCYRETSAGGWSPVDSSGSATTVSNVYKYGETMTQTANNIVRFFSVTSIEGHKNAFIAVGYANWGMSRGYQKKQWLQSGVADTTQYPSRAGEWDWDQGFLYVYSTGGNPNTIYGHVYFQDGVNPALDFLDCASCEVRNMDFRTCGVGVRVYSSATATAFLSMSILSCSADNCGLPYYFDALNATDYARIAGSIAYNNATYTQHTGIFLRRSASSVDIHDNSLTFANIHRSFGGIAFLSCSTSVNAPNNVYDNYVEGVCHSIEAVSDGAGIYLDSNSNFVNVYRNHVAHTMQGMVTTGKCDNQRIHHNFFDDVGYIRMPMADTSTSVAFVNNTLVTNTGRYGTYIHFQTVNSPLGLIAFPETNPVAVKYLLQNNIVAVASGSAQGIIYFRNNDASSTGSANITELNNIFQGTATVRAAASTTPSSVTAYHASTTIGSSEISLTTGLPTSASAKCIGWGASLVNISDQRDFYGRYPYGNVPAGCCYYIPNGTPTRTGL